MSDDRFVDLEWQPPAQPMLDAALSAARKADIVIAFVGPSPDLEGEEMWLALKGDRTTIGVRAAQEHLIEELGSVGKPLIQQRRTGT